MNCAECGAEFEPQNRKGKPGKFTHCEDCAVETTQKFSGNQIFSDKTAPEIQINTDPALTKYIAGGGWGPVETFRGGCHKPAELSPHRRAHN